MINCKLVFRDEDSPPSQTLAFQSMPRIGESVEVEGDDYQIDAILHAPSDGSHVLVPTLILK